MPHASQAVVVALFLASSILLTLAAPARGAEPSGSSAQFRSYRRPVMTWVPPYDLVKARDRMKDTPGMADSLTHLGLQFWCPTKTGGVEFAPFPDVTDAAVVELRDFGHAHGVRVMLCVYNAGTRTWDWPLARAAFADHREAFVKSLVTEMERLKLDGIDVDLEGDGDYPPTEQAPFVAFMTDLSKSLRARDKHLTVDTFAYEWHAPNQTWWPALFPLVDGLTTMGYEEIGMTATPAKDAWRAYAAQRDAAGEHKHKLMLGLPAGKDKWRGNTLAEQLAWIKNDGTTGLSFWDAQIPAKAWQSRETWEKVVQIRNGTK